MKIINLLVNLFDKLINNIVLVILVILLFYSGYALYDAYATYQKAELSDEILQYKPEENEKFSLESIQKEINEDICGWIRLDGTNIDYPMVIGKDNTEYLNNDYKKEYSITGSIFLDYRNDRNFKDDYTIIYGHNLKADLMFAEVRNYAEKKYFDEHSTGMLYTGDKIYKIDVLYFESVNAYSKVYSLTLRRNDSNKELINEFEKNAITKNSLIEANSKDKLILLSTCNSSDTETRSVLVGKLTEIEASKIINEEKDITLNEIDKQLSDKQKSENVQEVIKDKLDNSNYARNVMIVLIIIIIVLVIIIIAYIIKKKKENAVPKRNAKHMKK